MSEENKEHKRSPLIPRPPFESGLIAVPFDMYERLCSQCRNREKTLTSHDEYIAQMAKFMDEREPIKIICSAVNRCAEIQRRDDVKLLKERRLESVGKGC